MHRSPTLNNEIPKSSLFKLIEITSSCRNVAVSMIIFLLQWLHLTIYAFRYFVIIDKWVSNLKIVSIYFKRSQPIWQITHQIPQFDFWFWTYSRKKNKVSLVRYCGESIFPRNTLLANSFRLRWRIRSNEPESNWWCYWCC